MSKFTRDTFFSYYWFLDEKEEDVTSIRIYGVNEKEENICLRVDDFQPYIYIELPNDIQWTNARAQMIANRLDQLIPKNKAISKSFEMKYKLYGAILDENGERKKFPYLKCTFSHKDDIKKLGYALKKSINVVGMGYITLKMHEQDADPILQFVTNLDIPTAGWISFKGKEVDEFEKVTLCHKEYIVKSKNVCKHNKNMVGKVKIMGFDIEVNSTNPFAMPSPIKPGDKVFQISCVFTRDGSEIYDNYLLTLGEPDPEILGDDITIQMFDTEYELLEGFTELIREENPNIIVGYNILQFDIHYMIERAKREFCGTFYKMGFHKYNNSKEKTIKWSSSAYKNQEFQFLDAEGRVFVDLLPLIQRDYKFNNYQLKTVSINLLGDTKDDLSVKNIFKCYRIGTKRELDGTYSAKAKKAMGIVGKYCVKDSILVVKLMEKMQTWVGLCEQAKTYNTSIFSIYTQGQQIKVFSQVYKYCLGQDIVVEKDGYVAKEDERYVGAHVFPPVPGLYERVLPFDFCLSGDTLINLSNGLSKRIDSFNKDTLVMGFNKESNAFENFSFINGLQKKGIKDTVKIYFQDGSSIVATPEHKFMLENGEWCEAKDLKNKYVKSGIKFPEDKKCNLEKDWKLEVDEYILNMTTDEERNKSLAFARMCGYILSDGSIYLTTRGARKCAEACFGTMFDALAFKRDINLFSDVDVTIRRRDGDGNKEREKKGTTLSITIPSSLSKMFHSLEDIIVGKRATQEMKLPKFILEDNCPLSIIREFLAGLFGGDGGSSVLETKDSVTGINFKWTTIEKFIDQMKNVFYKIKNLLEKFNVICNINKPYKIKYTEKCIKPKDYKENPRYDVNLCILIDSLTYFNNNIGFRYCINKLGKSYFISMYIGMKEKTRMQRLKILDKSNELIDINVKNVFSRKKGNITFTDCLEIAREELLDKEPALYPISLSSTYDLTYDRHERIRHSDKNRKYSLHKKKFPSPIEYFKDINTLEWFTQKYLIKTDDINIPSFRQKVLDVREHEPTEVFDIEVDKVHNFLGNGVTASNCSLYPSVIIAYNIDYSTIVFDESIPDRLCNVMTWSDHSTCGHDPKVIRKNQLTAYIDKQQIKLKELREKRDKKINKLCRQEIVNEIDSVVEEMKPYREERAQLSKTISKNVMCAERHYRFLKEPKGVIPTILQNLLDARANTRSEIKIHKKEMLEIEDKDKLNDLKLLNVVLDKRQLAYKISANSMYGAMGVKKGYLPFLPGAMACTYMGRTNIEIVAKVIPEKYGGELVYGDTDSNYIHFPHLKTAHESWEHAEMVAEEVSKLFPKPISLAFEEAIYWQFFILTKKRYMYKSCGKNGVIEDSIGKKGVILSRRDSAVLVRTLYERTIEMIFDNIPHEDVIYFILQELNKICSNSFPHKDYVITKSVGDVNEMTVEPFIDEKGIKKARVGNYTVPILPTAKTERDKQLLLKDAEDEAEYYKKCLPAVVQLAEKMRSRGQRVDAGTRLEYVIIDNYVKNDKQYNKLENLDYFVSHSDILKIDFSYYVKLLINPIDQLLNVAFDNEKNNNKYRYKYQKDFLLHQYDFRTKVRAKVIDEIKNLFKPAIKFES